MVLKTPTNQPGYKSFRHILEEWKGNFIAHEYSKKFNE